MEKGNKYTIAGDQVQFVTSGEGVEYWQYKYDLLNQLVEVKKKGQVVSTYVYDPNGFRVIKSGSKGTVHYVPLLNGEVGYRKEIDTNKQYSFIYVGIQHLARVDGVIGGSGKKFYYHNDHLGTSLAVTDEAGNKMVERDFAPFGERIPVSATDSGQAGPNEDDSGFTGKDWDEDIGLYYYNARWYDASIGKFITEDSILDDPNLYSYCGQNPVNNTDPTGHWKCSVNWSSVLTTSISYVCPESGYLLEAVSAFKLTVGIIDNMKWAKFLKAYTKCDQKQFKSYLESIGVKYEFNEDNTKEYTFTNSEGQKPISKSFKSLALGESKLDTFEAMQGNIKAFLERNPGLSLEQVKGIFDSAVISADNSWGLGKNEFRFAGRGSNYHNIYESESVVMNEGKILGVFTRASTHPDDVTSATVDEGIYNYKVGRHREGIRVNTEINQPAPRKDDGGYLFSPLIKLDKPFEHVRITNRG